MHNYLNLEQTSIFDRGGVRMYSAELVWSRHESFKGGASRVMSGCDKVIAL